MVLGSDSTAIKEGRAFGIQSLSGTGALRNGGDFLAMDPPRGLGRRICYVSDPTWGNHIMLFKSSGFTEVRKYRYIRLRKSRHAKICSKNQFFRENVVVI